MRIAFIISVLCLAGCASQPESITTEHRGKVTVVHHRRRIGNGAVDRIEAISANGSVSQAEVHVYDLGRYVDASGDIHEAHKMYRTVQSERPNLMLPKRVSAGPRSSYVGPTYSPPPQSQRIDDAVAEAKKAAEDLRAAKDQVAKRLEADNSLRGELQDQIEKNQQLTDQLNSAMATPSHQKPAPETDAQKAAAGAVSDLQKWGQQIGGNQ